ncbi:hypothetical protein AB0P17_36200 [Streptomyces sp. NPDC088124]|uniref:hypothetical protein n=1 Tax=Streptomyces sp. NPDC088124 TaxID=3154654 RepID=UPI003449E84A
MQVHQAACAPRGVCWACSASSKTAWCSARKRYAIAGGTAQAALRVLRAEGLVDIVHGRGTFVAALPQAATAVPGETADARRVEALEDTLRDVLSHIRPQGHPSWELNTCLVSKEQLTKWWAALGVTPQRQTPPE